MWQLGLALTTADVLNVHLVIMEFLLSVLSAAATVKGGFALKAVVCWAVKRVITTTSLTACAAFLLVKHVMNPRGEIKPV